MLLDIIRQASQIVVRKMQNKYPDYRQEKWHSRIGRDIVFVLNHIERIPRSRVKSLLAARALYLQSENSLQIERADYEILDDHRTADFVALWRTAGVLSKLGRSVFDTTLMVSGSVEKQLVATTCPVEAKKLEPVGKPLSYWYKEDALIRSHILDIRHWLLSSTYYRDVIGKIIFAVTDAPHDASPASEIGTSGGSQQLYAQTEVQQYRTSSDHEEYNWRLSTENMSIETTLSSLCDTFPRSKQCLEGVRHLRLSAGSSSTPGSPAAVNIFGNLVDFSSFHDFDRNEIAMASTTGDNNITQGRVVLDHKDSPTSSISYDIDDDDTRGIFADMLEHTVLFIGEAIMENPSLIQGLPSDAASEEYIELVRVAPSTLGPLESQIVTQTVPALCDVASGSL